MSAENTLAQVQKWRNDLRLPFASTVDLENLDAILLDHTGDSLGQLLANESLASPEVVAHAKHLRDNIHNAQCVWCKSNRAALEAAGA